MLSFSVFDPITLARMEEQRPLAETIRDSCSWAVGFLPCGDGYPGCVQACTHRYPISRIVICEGDRDVVGHPKALMRRRLAAKRRRRLLIQKSTRDGTTASWQRQIYAKACCPSALQTAQGERSGERKRHVKAVVIQFCTTHPFCSCCIFPLWRCIRKLIVRRALGGCRSSSAKRRS